MVLLLLLLLVLMVIDCYQNPQHLRICLPTAVLGFVCERKNRLRQVIELSAVALEVL